MPKRNRSTRPHAHSKAASGPAGSVQVASPQQTVESPTADTPSDDVADAQECEGKATPAADSAIAKLRADAERAAIESGFFDALDGVYHPHQTLWFGPRSVKFVPGNVPSVCPHADPFLPAQFARVAEQAFQRLGAVPAGHTTHYVGEQSTLETTCACDSATVGVAPVNSPQSDARLNDPKQLTEAQQKVFDFIKSKGPVMGKEIIKQFGMGASTLTTHYIPALEKHGVKNIPRKGYVVAV